MKSKIFLIILLITLVGLFFFYLSQNKSKEALNIVCFEKNCFEVEVVKTELQKQRGLMYRKDLPEKAGMLFVYDEPAIQSFWMKNTLIPLDIIWIKESEVVFVSHNTPPCKKDPCPIYTPDKEADAVLEINGGLAEKLNIKAGIKAVFKN